MNVRSLFIVVVCFGLGSSSLAQEDGSDDAKTADALQQRYAAFEEMLSGSKLVGRFTILGRDMSNLPKEEYTINSVKKLPKDSSGSVLYCPAPGCV